MKRVIRGSVTSLNNTDLQSEYEYRRKIYLERKHEFETLGEEGNNDVLSREEKMNIAKAEMDKVAPKSVKSAKDATFKTDKRLSPTSERYKGYLIVLDRGGDGYNVYDKYGELEDAGYPSRKAAKEFIDELVEADNDIRASSITAKQMNRIASTSHSINYQVIASICSMEDVYSEHATLEEAIDSAERAQQSFMNVKIKDVATGECWLDIEDAKYDLYNGFVESATTFKTDKRLSPIAAAINDERTDYEIEHGITYTRSYSNKYGDQISIFVYDDDPDKQEYGEGGPSGDYFRGRWTQNMQDYYTRKGFKLDSTSDLDASSNVKASNDGYNPYSFMVGDQLEWSGLYGDQYKGIVTNVDDEYVTVEVMWTSEDSGNTIIDTQQFEIATDPDGKECIIVWTYGSDAGYVYPPSNDYINSAYEYDVSDSDYNDDIQEIDQEFTSENTSINSKKLPAIFKMVSFEPGTINLDMGGGKFDNVADYLSEYDVTNLVYDPYNRTKEHNREVVKTIRQVGGADTATCSNVLNVIKEPEARRNVLVNMSKLVKPNGDIYITVYEGSGKGNEGVTKSGYQLNRKTADYLEEIQQVFPDAVRRGKLIVATNSSSANSSTDIQSSYNAYGDILSFICPICQNDTVYSTEKDIYHPCEVDYEELFICDECGAELKAYPKYDGTVDFIPLMDDEY